jgi:hypothetical protein
MGLTLVFALLQGVWITRKAEQHERRNATAPQAPAE